MSELCDIHNHLLPEVDDGCTSMAETLRYLQEFRGDGVTDLVFSPHLLVPNLDDAGIDVTLELHRERFGQLLEDTDGDDSVPRIHLGQETLLRQPADADRVVGRTDIGLAGGATLLVEFGFQPGFDGDGVIERVRAEGRAIVVAHPERYRFGPGDPLDVIRRWRDAGAALQVNGGSFDGLYTEAAQDISNRMLDEGLVDLVSTDHHGDFRAHSVAAIAASIESRGGRPCVERLMAEGPRATFADATALRG